MVCENCFAVFAIPDTQLYTAADPPFEFQPQGGAHFDLIMRWICAHSANWTEPSTGKQMPILITLGLGDMIHSSLKVSQWAIASAAYDVLETCDINHAASFAELAFKEEVLNIAEYGRFSTSRKPV